MDTIEQSVEIPVGGVMLEAEIAVPVPSRGMVLLVHDESADHGRPKIGHVAGSLQDAGFATTLLGPLTDAHERVAVSSPVSVVVRAAAEGVIAVIDWLFDHDFAPDAEIGLFGAGLGAAASLMAAVARTSVAAVVACGGGTDLAGDLLRLVRQPTLVIAGEGDHAPAELDRLSLTELGGEAHLEVLAGDVDEVARLARDWFVRHLGPRGSRPAAL